MSGNRGTILWHKLKRLGIEDHRINIHRESQKMAATDNLYSIKSILLEHVIRGSDLATCLERTKTKTSMSESKQDEIIASWNTPHFIQADIVSAGCALTLHCIEHPSLIEYYVIICFTKIATKVAVNLVSCLHRKLLSSNVLIEQVYLQIQMRQRQGKTLEDWKRSDVLIPITKTELPAPEKVLNLIPCSCNNDISMQL